MTRNTSLILTDEQMLELVKISKIGVWVWNLKTDVVIYSKEYAELLGYEKGELEQSIDTWEKLTHPQDLPLANLLIESHLNGKSDFYEAEFRMFKKDGSVVWLADKGRVTEYDENGEPLLLCGVIQNIDKLKTVEEQLREQSSLLNLIINISGFATWDWDVKNETIHFNSEFTQMLGLPASYKKANVEERISRMHPEDFEIAFKSLNDYLAGNSNKYEAVLRLKHADGRYIWTKDIGRIIERDEHGTPTRLIGGHLNINELMQTQEELTNALAKVEDYQYHLEQQIERRTKTILDHDKMLTAVNKISQQLVALTDYKKLNIVMDECLQNFTKAGTRNKVSIWRATVENDQLFAKVAFHSNLSYLVDPNAVKKKILEADIEKVTGGKFTNDQRKEFFKFVFDGNNVYNNINYDDHLPSIAEAVKSEMVLNTLVKNLTPLERFYMSFQDIKALIITPISLNGALWGFMMLTDFVEERTFNEIEENMLRITGTMFANAIQKAETDEELRLAHEEAIMSSQAKSNFLANMSHEIRTPMNAISGMAEIILRENTDPTITEYASGIKSASNSLLTIINDILDISKIESGKLDIIETEYHLPSMLNDIVNIARMRLENKPLALFTYIDSTLPAVLVGDEIRIKQIIINILNNAIKFTPSGHILFRVTGNHRNGKSNLCFEVIDTGSGIKEEDMEKLFEEFERFDTKKNRNIEGTGLGLAISKKLCEMMGGSISASSVFGEGSTFTMNIVQKYDKYAPIALVPEAKKILLYESRELYTKTLKDTIENLGSSCAVCTNQSELYEMLIESKYDCIFAPALHLRKVQTLIEKQKLNSRIVLLAEASYTKLHDDDIFIINLPAHCMQVANALNNTTSSFILDSENLYFTAPSAKVLIVDDNPVNLKVATELMRPYEFEIDTAQNGIEAVAKIKNTQYDLVFMDHMMPEMDGIDATIEIRNINEAYYQELPIIALTANAIVGTKELFTGEGMNDFLAKPIEISKLNEVLSIWLPKDKIIAQSPEFKTKTESSFSLEINNVDVNYGIKMLGGNFDNYIDIIMTYYQDGVKKHSIINDYYEQKNLLAFKTEVHAIKSASASIGALDLSSQAAKLEEASAKEDWIFIEKQTHLFLDDFALLLEDLREALAPYHAAIESSNKNKKKGDKKLLFEKIENLSEALQFIDITKIEETLALLISYSWSTDIQDNLNKIQEEILSYEYDKALPYINSIKKILLNQK